MVKVLEGKHGSSRKCGLAGLARLRRECHRFREEVACIRTFPRLQLRWPSLARLEIGTESSEEDDTVWDAAAAQRPDTLFISKETRGVSEACARNVVEILSPKLGSLRIDSKAEGIISDEKLGGLKENERRFLEGVQSSQKTHDSVDVTLGCEEVAVAATCCNGRNKEDEVESQGPSEVTSETKMAHQVLEPVTAVKVTSDPSHDGSLMDPESRRDSPKGQSLNTLHTQSGARIAATALFTANPRYNSHEQYTACNPNCNFTCQSEGFKLVAFPGSYVSDNPNRKEREVWSEQVSCSSFESHICSPSELHGYYATGGKRNQTSTPIETNSPAHPDRRLLTSMHLMAPSCSSDVDYEWDVKQAKIGFMGPEICVAPVHACPGLTGQDQSVLDNVKQKGLERCTSNSMKNCGMLTSSVGDPSRTAADYVQSMQIQNQNGIAELGNQKDDLCLTDDSAGARRVSMTFMSGLAETSLLPTSSSLQNDSYSVFPTEFGSPSASKNEGSGRLGLITLSGLKNFAKLGVGSTRDSVMTAQMAKRIKHALERLGDIGNQGNRKSCVSIKKGKWTDEIYATWKNSPSNSEAASESILVRTDSKRVENLNELVSENNKNRKSESHFLIHREHGKQTLGNDQISKQTRESKSVTPEEPDLYLQSVIAALDSTYESHVKESTLKSSTSATGLQADQHCPTRGRDGGVSPMFSKANANGPTLTTPGEVFQCPANKDCVADHRMLRAPNVARPDTMLEETYSADYLDSIRELLSRPHHIDEEQDTVGQNGGESAKLSMFDTDGSTLTTPCEMLNCHSDKDCAADHSILDSTNVAMADNFLEEKHLANEVYSTDELISKRYPTDEEPSTKVSTEDLPAFTVQICAPPGSCLQIEVGDQPTVYGELEEANQEVLGNSVIYPTSTSGGQRKFNMRVVQRKPRLLQQRSLQIAPWNNQERPVEPPSSAVDPLSTLNKAEERRKTKQASLSELELSPPRSRQEGSLSRQFSPTMRSSTQEDLRHSFDRKITSLVKKANQLQEEGRLPCTSTHKQRGSGCRRRRLEVTGPKRQPDSFPSTKASDTFRYGDSFHEGRGPNESIAKRIDAENNDAARATQSKVTRAQPPSILKSAADKKLLDLDSSSCANHRDSQAARTAMKMHAFGAAAAGLAHELNVLMKDRRSPQNGKSQAPNKRKVAWASPEAYELGPGSTVKPPTSQSGMQPGPCKHKLSTQQPTTRMKSAWHDDRAAPATQAVSDVRKTKELRKGPLRKPCKAPRHPEPEQKLLVGNKSEIYDAVCTSPILESSKKQVSQETVLRSEQPQSVPESGGAGATEVLDASAGETFDYDQFRQELKDLQVERMKLERLVHTIFTTDADPMEQRCLSSPFSAQEGKPEDNLARHLQKNPDFTGKSSRRDPSLGNPDKRKRNEISANKDSRKSVVGSDSGLQFPSQREQMLHGENGLNDAVGIWRQECAPPGSLVTLSDDALGNKATRKSHPQVYRMTNHRGGSILEEEKYSERSPSTSIPSGQACHSNREHAKDVPEKLQQHSQAGSDTNLQSNDDQNIGFNGKSASESHLSANWGFSSTDVLHERFPNLKRILSVEDGPVSLQSTYPAPKLQVAEPDYFKEYLLQALDSSILLLQQCVNGSDELQDPALPNRPESSNMHPSTDLAARTMERIVDNSSKERRTQVDVADDAFMGLPARPNELDHLQEHLNKLDLKVQLLQQGQDHLKDGDVAYQQKLKPTMNPQKSVVPSPQIVESGEPQVENCVLEIQKTAFDRPRESESKGSSSEKDTCWSGSLKSVMEAYEEAQRTAALLISSSPEVYKSKGRQPSSCGSEHSQKLVRAEKLKPRMEGMQKRKEKVCPLMLLEEAEKAEAKELKLRNAKKKTVKSKQNSLSTGLRGGKGKLQGRFRKHHSGREQWKVSELLLHRTADLAPKRREDWNDSTEISYDKHGMGWKPNYKEGSQALITKILNESVRKQRSLGFKHLMPLEADLRRKKRDPVSLETYANTIAQMRGREKSSLTKGNPFIEEREGGEAQVIEDDVHTKQSTQPVSMERNATDRRNYLIVSRNLLETDNHVLDESTMVFKRAREHKGQLNSRFGTNHTNQDVRESIEHWLDTSGGFEFLDSYNEAGEEDIFERQESTDLMQRNPTLSMMTGVSERSPSDEIFPEKLFLPSSENEGRRASSSRTLMSERLGNDPRGNLGSTSSSANRNAIQCSLGKHEEFPHRGGSGHEDDHAGGSSPHSYLKAEKSSLDGGFGIVSGSDHIVGGLPSQEPAHMESIHGGEHLLCREDENMYPPQGDDIPSSTYCVNTAAATVVNTDNLFPCEDENSLSPKLGVDQAHTDPLLQARDFEEKLTEEEELEIALLEIVLQTILKDDPPSETVATLTSGVLSAPTKRHSVGSSGTPLTGRVTPMSIDNNGLRDGAYFDRGMQTSIPHLPSLDFPTQEHGTDSTKSSGGDWPEYKCLAEMQSGSQSLEEDEHRPEYIGVDEVEGGVDQGSQIEELPLDQISSPSTNEVETDEKVLGGTLPPRGVPVSTRAATRPPYSAVHSIRAAERQTIDFPGIASLAFGYPSPRIPPESKQIGQTSGGRSSVSVQTADMAMTQSTPPSTSVCVVPLYCLPPYSMYLPPSPPSGVPSPASAMPMTLQGQHGSQFIPPQYAAGVVPFFPPSYMFPPSAPFSQCVSQTSVVPVAPIVQNSQQTQTAVYNPPFPPSSSHPSATEGPSQRSKGVQFAPTSAKNTSSHSGQIFVDVAEDSPSSSDSCRSSLATPSTILSSPEHESRVAAILARPSRIGRGLGHQAFEEGSSDDDAEACEREEVGQRKEGGGAQPNDRGNHVPPCSTTFKEGEDPLLQSILANSHKQSRNEIAPALDSLPAHMASSNEFILHQHSGRSDQPEPGTSQSVDSARSSVLVASYDGSGSSEGSVKRTRGTASVKSSGQSSLDGIFRPKHTSPKPAGRVGFSQTSSRSSGEILGSYGVSLRRLNENQKMLRRRFSSRTLPLSEGEVEPGQMPSEGEYFGPIPNAWGPHPRLLVNTLAGSRDIISEPGEISKQSFMQLRPPRSEVGEGYSSRTESLSEGELRVQILTEPGEVRENSELPESHRAGALGDLAK